MQIITAKVGEEIRSRHQRPSEPPIAVVAWAQNGEVTIVLRDSDDDLQLAMHNLAASERQHHRAKESCERRIERRRDRRYA